jgi:hypothetical protein
MEKRRLYTFQTIRIVELSLLKRINFRFLKSYYFQVYPADTTWSQCPIAHTGIVIISPSGPEPGPLSVDSPPLKSSKKLWSRPVSKTSSTVPVARGPSGIITVSGAGRFAVT